MKRILVLLLTFLLVCLNCVNAEPLREPRIPEGHCEKELKELGYKYDSSDFATAVLNNDEKAVELFLLSGVDPNIKYLSEPLITMAIYNKNLEITELFLKYGANPNLRYRKFGTPLGFAIQIKSPEMVDLLIAYGADIENEGRYLFNPLKYAISRKSYPIVESLLKAGAKIDETTIDRAQRCKDENIKSLVLEYYNKQNSK